MRGPFRRHGGEQGQIAGALLLFVVVLVSGGLLLFQVGRAAASRADAVTAADAAALAAARDIADQLPLLDMRRAGIDDASARRAAADYAQRNGARLVAYERSGFDVRVRVETAASGGDARRAGGREVRGRARAQARVEPLWGAGGGVPIGNVRGEIGDAIRLGQSMGLTLTSFYRPNDRDSLHSLGIAADLAGPPQLMAKFYLACLQRYSYIEELFYDPLGGIDKNVSIGAIGGHSDHVHIALTGGGPGADPHDAPPVPPGAVHPDLVIRSTVRLVPYDD